MSRYYDIWHEHDDLEVPGGAWYKILTTALEAGWEPRGALFEEDGCEPEVDFSYQPGGAAIIRVTHEDAQALADALAKTGTYQRVTHFLRFCSSKGFFIW